MTKENKPKNVKEIIERSGNAFHYRVVGFLRAQDWQVLVSPYYTDSITDKPREIDIIAEKAFGVKDHWGRWIGTVNVQLFIECKYINGDTVFWFDAKDKEKAVERLMADTHLESPLRNSGINGHRYMSNQKVAKLFASDNKSSENDIIYKAINQSLSALVYHRSKGAKSIIPKGNESRPNVLETLTYPVIICSDFAHFYQLEPPQEEDSREITDNFQLEVNYAYIKEPAKSVSEYFLIDVVDFSTLSDFLDIIEKTDVKTVSDCMAEIKRENNREAQQENSGFNQAM